MSIDTLLDTIKKKHGDGAVFKLNDSSIMQIDRISTGSINLDIALGGGIPIGRMTTVAGEYSTGKTTLMCHILAEAQKKFPDKHVGIVDVEFALDRDYTAKIGVDLDRAIVSQPKSAQEAWDIVEEMVKSNAVSVVFLDSIAALVNAVEAEQDGYDDMNIALNARLNSKAMRKIIPQLKPHNATLLLSNQLRDNIGGFGYGNSKVEVGGKMIDFSASVKIHLSRKGTNKAGGEAVSNTTIAKIKKNKVAPPFREAEFNIRFGEGIDKPSELINLAIEHKLVSKRGAWFSLVDPETGEILEDKKGQGEENFRALLTNEDYDQLEKLIREKLGL